MAPRKTLKISNDTPQIKKTKGRPRKIQPLTSIKIQIPVQQRQEPPPKCSRKNKISLERKIELANKETPKKYGRKSKLSLERQIELANEVVRTQLTRNVRIKADPNVTELAAKIFDCTNIVQNNVEDEDKKVTIRKVTRKGANKKTETEAMVKPSTTRKRAADSTQQPAKKRKVTVKDTVIPKPKNIQKQTATPKRIIQKKKTIQGKKKNKDVVCPVQNSLPMLDVIDIPVEVVKEFAEPAAAAIDSRKTSMTSASGFSWTKDISSSSTTTCVTVSTNDFVRIDKKLPVLQLINVDREVHKYKRSEIDDSTSDSDSSSSDSISHVDLVDLASASLNLSTSSPSIYKGNQNCTPKSDSIKGDVTKALVKLSSMLKNFDMEIMNWIGYGENGDESTKKCNEKILKVLKEESHVIAHCRQLKDILSEKGTDEVDNADAQFNAMLSNDLNVSFDDNNPITKDNVLLNENVEYLRSPKSPSTAYDSDYALDNYNMSFERNNDDDDALSLFAESITGIEPSRTNDSDSPSPAQVDNDEYIPRPVNKDTSNSSEKYKYCPTKITKPDGVKKNVCEKQNADSTSIYKEVDRVSNKYQGDGEGCASEPPVSRGNNLEDGELASTEELPNQIGPPPVTSIFQQVPRKRTIIFRGLCFYNLMNMCKKKRCCYPHLVPNSIDVKTRLMRLSESIFIEEYIFLSSWPMLRRIYGLYFVEECHRRGLPRILVEMAIDFVVNIKPKSKEDSDFQLLVLENILLCLNDVGLAVCEDLLNRRMDGDIRLCDVFMRVIAISQNFSRFKHVFLNLTNVMVRNRRTFSSDIVEQILERVCILPAEQQLLRSVFDIIKNTDSCIFSNKMMCHFETRLRTVNSGWHKEFVEYRNANVNTSLNVFSTMSPLKGKDMEPLKVNCINNDEKERYTSPDTTKVDTLYKAATEPTITRTVNLTRTCYNSFNSTPTKNNVEDWLNNKFQNWRQKSPMTAPVPLMSLPPMRLSPRNGRVVTDYRTSPTKYHQKPPRKF